MEALKTNIEEEIEKYFSNLKSNLKQALIFEMAISTENILKEINKTKLELGACFENGIRKFESKLEKYFENDESLNIKCKERKKFNLFKKLFVQ